MTKRSEEAQSYWVVVTCLSDILLAITLLFFGSYGAALCGLITAVIAIGSTHYTILMIPSMMLSIYGIQKGILILKELWPWNEPYDNNSQALSYAWTAIAFMMVAISIFVALASICVATMNSGKKGQRNQSATNIGRPPQVIVSEYQPQLQEGATVPPQLPPPRVAQPPPPPTVAQPPPPPPGAALIYPGVTTVPVVQRSASGNIYTEEGILYSGPDGKPTVFSHTTNRDKSSAAAAAAAGAGRAENPYIIVTTPPSEPQRAHVQVTVTPHD